MEENLIKPQRYSETTRDIKVTVEPRFLEDRSAPDDGVYVFSYTVTLENVGGETAQLINRHWKVFSGERQFSDVKGEGVIGEQPVIEPGVGYQYSSWTVIDQATGSMEGSYTFRSDFGEFFDVTIPKFELVYLDPASFH